MKQAETKLHENNRKFSNKNSPIYRSQTPVSRTPSKMESEQTVERSERAGVRGIDSIPALLSFIKRLRLSISVYLEGSGAADVTPQPSNNVQGRGTRHSVYTLCVCMYIYKLIMSLLAVAVHNCTV